VLPWYLHLPESLARWRITGHWLDGSLSAGQAISAPFVLAWSLLSGRGPWGGSIRSEQIGALLVLPVVLGLLYRARSTVLSPPWLLAWSGSSLPVPVHRYSICYAVPMRH
jgi:hypothetical protein